MTDIRESDKIYHKCFNKNKDRTNKLIKKGEKCLTPTYSPFWKSPWDFPNGVRTRSQEKKQKKITTKKFIKCFQNIENIQWWLTARFYRLIMIDFILQSSFFQTEKKIKNL